MKRYYTQDHLWVDVEGDEATVGLSPSVQEAVGEIIYLALPTTGELARRTEPAGVVESTKAATDLSAPLSGTITSINSAINCNAPPSDLSSHWLYKLHLSDPSELSHLISE